LSEIADDSCGAVTVFLGCVRNVNDGKSVTGIEYSAYRSMAEREMGAIAREAADRFDVTRLVIEHRVGALVLGDVSVAVVAAHPHRGPALDAMRFAIEQLKRRVPIWKLELYTDGTREWVGAQSGIGNPREPAEGEQMGIEERSAHEKLRPEVRAP
jgi:molybdopterin synthase catalytic subunit